MNVCIEIELIFSFTLIVQLIRQEELYVSFSNSESYNFL